ncbi:hypothetical protein MPSEU_000043200 [Mayamaea pseudoterrestris]|nr:hypothetical protein MPSEU_000043200 [Mayamaea pseudoterrestris]
MTETDVKRKDWELATVEVFGAGMSELCGTYKFAGRSEAAVPGIDGSDAVGAPRYSMEGTKDGKPATYWMDRVDECSSWRIGCFSDDTLQYYYQSNAASDVALMTPPTRLWSYIGPDVPAERQAAVMRPPILLYENERLVDWRQDPKDSHADCKIEITSSGASTVYHVHKNRLAGLLQGLDFLATKVLLNDLSAAAFPILLDYLYSGGNLVHVRVGRHDALVGLYWLACHLKMHRLKHILQVDLMATGNKDPLSCAGYLIPAAAIGLDEDSAESFVSEKAIQLITDHLDKLTFQDDAALEQLASKLTLSALLAVLWGNQERSQLCSLVVAKFCESPGFENAKTFFEVTDPTVLPELHPQATWPLLQKERELVANDTLSNLQERCVTALAMHWDNESVTEMHGGAFYLQSKAFQDRLMEKAQHHTAIMGTPRSHPRTPRTPRTRPGASQTPRSSKIHKTSQRLFSSSSGELE